MTLNVTYSCLAKTSYIALAFNVLLTIYLGIQMPKKVSPNSRSSNWTIRCDRPRSAREPPFFFREVRIGMLVVSILFNLGRLMYEAIVKDVSVVLVASRLCLTIVQLADHWWFCKNWESFFIEKKMRAYIWFRLFITAFLFSMLYCVQTTFSPYRFPVWIIDSCQWIAGIQAIVWYLWGKQWDFKWGDMSDERRLPAIVGAMFTSALVYGILSVYLLATPAQPIPVTSITGTIAYVLMGFAFRYLNIITNRSTQACLRILEESKVASAIDAHSRGILGDRSSTAFADRSVLPERGNSDDIQQPSSSLTPVSSTRRHSNLMVKIRRSLDSRIESSRPGSREEPSLTAEDAERKFGNDIEMISHDNCVKMFDEEDEEKGIISRQTIRERTQPASPFVSPNRSRNGSSSHVDGGNKIVSNSRPHESGSDNIETASVSTNQAAGSVRVKPIHLTAPIVSPTISRSGSVSHADNSTSGCNTSIASNRPHDSGGANIGSASARSNVGGGGVDSDRVRVKPNNSHKNSNSNVIVPLAPPLGDIINDHLVIDHLPLARQNSLEANFTTYETAHLLCDKVVVVFVQVVLWYTFMMVIERCIESYYEPEGYDDASNRIPPMAWCPVLSIFAGSTFASIQRIIDALF